jgi:hypothetical protein
MMRSTSADLTLGAGEYQIFLKIEADRHYPLYFVQEVVRANVQTRRAKLLQVALNPSIAHCKVRDEAECEENAAKKRAKKRAGRRELSKFKTRVGKKIDEGQEAQEASREHVISNCFGMLHLLICCLLFRGPCERDCCLAKWSLSNRVLLMNFSHKINLQALLDILKLECRGSFFIHNFCQRENKMWFLAFSGSAG